MSFDDDSLDLVFGALANKTRRAILERLAQGAATVNELAEPFLNAPDPDNMSLPAISKHIKVLERAGLITRGQTAQYRPCRLEPAPLITISEWATHYRTVWQSSFDRMDDYLDQLNSNEDTSHE